MFQFYHKVWEECRYYLLPGITIVAFAVFLTAKPLYHCRGWLGPTFCNPVLWLSWQDHLMFPLPGDVDFKLHKNDDGDIIAHDDTPEIGFVLLSIASAALHIIVAFVIIIKISSLLKWANHKKRGY